MILAVMLLLAMGIVFTTRMALTVSIIKMAPQKLVHTTTNECPANSHTVNESNNGTHEDTQLEFDWSAELQGYIMSASYVGMICFQIPSGVLANHMSAKYLMLLAVGTNSLLTLLTPFCVRGNYSAIIMIIFRIIIGAGEGSVLPALAELVLAWFPTAERTRSISFVTSGGQVSYYCIKLYYHFRCLYLCASLEQSRELHYRDIY